MEACPPVFSGNILTDNDGVIDDDASTNEGKHGHHVDRGIKDGQEQKRTQK